jgi:hypothetical protein
MFFNLHLNNYIINSIFEQRDIFAKKLWTFLFIYLPPYFLF